MISIEIFLPTHLLLRVDNIVNKFITSVLLAADISDVGWACTDEFNEISNEIEYEKFATPNLPPWISEVISKLKSNETETPSSNSTYTPAGSSNRKSNKRKRRNLDDMIHNEHIPARCKITLDEYTKVLADNKYKGKKPKIKERNRKIVLNGTQEVCASLVAPQKLLTRRCPRKTNKKCSTSSRRMV